MAPWNFPFNLSIGPLVSALAAGNSVTLKPSELTPFTEKLIVQMLGELFDKNEVAVVTGDAMVGAALLEQPWNHIFFTGSPQVGKLVMEAASKNLSSVTLELGGRNPAIVDSTASVKDAAEKLIWGKCFNAGQSCVSPNYLFVHTSKYDDFLKELKIACEKIFGPDRSQLNNVQTIARIVNNKHYNRIKSLVAATVEEGAEVFLGGNFVDSDNYISPTVLTNVTPESVIFQEEIFGPILPILKYDNWLEVYEVINSGEIPLALYIFSRSNKNIKSVLQNTSAGTSCVNDTTIQFIHPELPFGGHNFSGIGKAHGKYGFLEFSNERSVLRQRIGFTTVKMIYPPYNKLKRKVINILTWRL
jgi:aldehyde dehydrogenase (NAD+)